jgi:hypothetical protein
VLAAAAVAKHRPPPVLEVVLIMALRVQEHPMGLVQDLTDLTARGQLLLHVLVTTLLRVFGHRHLETPSLHNTVEKARERERERGDFKNITKIKPLPAIPY